jgi:hypothetical protein
MNTSAALPIVVIPGLATAWRPGTTTELGHRPSHFGARFSENALGPSI